MAGELAKRVAQQEQSQGKQQSQEPVRLMPESMQNAFGQMGAGTLELLAPSPKAEPGSAAFFVPGGAREVYNLANMVGEFTGLGQLPAAEHNRRMQHATRQASSDVFNVEEPDSTLDLAFRAAGGAVVPGGAAARTGQAATRAGRAGDLAARIAIPLNQGRTGREFATEAAAGVALPVGVQETLGATGTVPQEQFDTFLEPSQAQAQTEQQNEQTRKSGSLASRLNAEPVSRDTGDGQDRKQKSIYDKAAEANEQFLRQQSKDEDEWIKWAIGGAAAIGGPLVVRNMWRNHKLKQQARAESARLETDVSTIFTPREEATARTVDTLEGITLSRERFTGTRDEQFRDAIALAGNPIARSARADSAVETGVWPTKLFTGSADKGNMKMPFSPRTVANAIRRHPQADEVRRLIEMRDELQNRKFFSSKTLENVTTRFINQSNDDLANEISRIENSVQDAKALADRYSQITRSSLDYMKARGFINEQDYTNMIQAHPNYVPRMYPREHRGMWDRLFGNTDDSSVADNVQQDILGNRRSETVTEEPVYQPPESALEDYVRGLTSAIDTNEIRLKYLRDSGFKEVRPGPGGQAPKGTVSVRVPSGNGTRTAHYDVPDPFARHLLEFQAPMARTVNNAIRQIFQGGTTGRFNPFFAPVSAWYDASLLERSVSRKNPRRVGLLPADLAKNIPDLTARPLALTSGTARGVWGSMKEGAHSIVDEHLKSNSVLREWIGDEALQGLSDRLANAYANSTLAMARSGGGLSGRFNIDPAAGATPDSLLMRYTGKTPASRRAKNAYTAFLDSIQNSARLEYFARNYRKGMNNAEINRLLRDTREVTGDFSRAGAGGVHMQGRNLGLRALYSTAGGFTRAVPYGNVMIQAMRRYGQMAKENPQLFVSSLITSVALPQLASWYRAQSLTENGEYDYVDYYWNQLSWQDRLTSIYWFQEGEPPQNALKVRMLPEDAVFAGILMGLWDSVAGWSSGQYNKDGNNDFNTFMKKVTDADSFGELLQEMNEGAAQGVSRTLTPGLPPAMRAFGALSGQEYRVDAGAALEGELPIEARKIYSEHIPEGRTIADTLHGEQLQALLTAFGGIAADTAIKFGEAADRAYYGTGDLSAGLRDGGYVALRETTRFLPGNNMLFGSEGRRSVYGDRAEKISEKEQAAKRVKEQLRQVTGAENVTRLDRRQLLFGQTAGMQDANPKRLMMAQEVAGFLESRKSFQTRLDAQWDRLNGIDRSTTIPASQKTQLRNSVMEKMAEQREAYYEDMLDFEEYMSKKYNTQFRLEDFQLR
jgi:ribosomal protein S8